LIDPWIVLKYSLSRTLALMLLKPASDLQGSEEDKHHERQSDYTDDIIKV